MGWLFLMSMLAGTALIFSSIDGGSGADPETDGEGEPGTGTTDLSLLGTNAPTR